jgi:SAM-dependent methyltransferase
MTNEGNSPTQFYEPTDSEIRWTIISYRLFLGRFYKDYANRLGLRGNENLIDYGSGSGFLTELLAKLLINGGRVTSIDLSKKWQAVARKRLEKYSNVDFMQGVITALPLPGSHYDAVSIHFMLHDLPRSTRQSAADCLYDKLKPGGYLFIREPQRVEHGMRLEEIHDIMMRAGFKEIALKTEPSNFVIGNMTVGRYIKPG